MKKSWYSITNKSDTECVVELYDEIGMWGISAKDFLNELKTAGGRKIKLRINSPGGEVFDGLAIYNRLCEHAPGVEVCIDGIAASMASVIAMCGAPIKMAENALLMIHNPSGLCIGNSEDMRELADMLDKVKGSLTGAYERKTGKTSEEICQMMDDETWLNASEASEHGFIDEITSPMKMAAKFDKLKMEGKLAERENNIDTLAKEDNALSNSIANSLPNFMEPTKTAAEIELERIEAKRIEDERAKELKDAEIKATASERLRVANINKWAGDVEAAQKIDLKEVTAKFIEEGKSLEEFKDHVITNTFKPVAINPPTDTSGAQGNTMKRDEFSKLSPYNQSDFCRKGGKIVD